MNAPPPSPPANTARAVFRPALETFLGNPRRTRLRTLLFQVHLWVGLPRKSDDDISVRKKLPGDWRLTGSNYVHLDQYTGRVLSVERHSERSRGERFLRAMFPLHVGTFGGWFTRILWAALGLVPALLFVTGFLMWSNRVVRPRLLALRSGEATLATGSKDGL